MCPTDAPHLFNSSSLRPLIIAVDGPAASGKGTLSRKLASRYGLAYLDTGSLYRAVAHALLKAGQKISDEAAAAKAAQALDLDAIDQNAIRTADIGAAASIVAAMAPVRSALTQLQHKFTQQPQGAVLDGRDIGTVICPHAPVKFFVTASAEIRARRRFLELQQTDPQADEARVLADILARDTRDASRERSPLVMASDAHLLDTTDLDIEAALKAAVAIVDQTLQKGAEIQHKG